MFRFAKSNGNIMKQILLLIAMLPLLFASCAKESPMDIDKEESVYYVKYTASIIDQDMYLGVVSYRNEKGEMIEVGHDGIDRKNFEVIIGPVSCGFECLISVTGYTTQTNIECSKNNSPFAFKASGRNGVTSTIDY